MASIQYTAIPVSPGADGIFAIDLSAWEPIVNGDTVASGTVDWTGPAPGTVAGIAGSGQKLTVHLAGFSNGTTHYGIFHAVSSSGDKDDFYVAFACGKPTNF